MSSFHLSSNTLLTALARSLLFTGFVKYFRIPMSRASSSESVELYPVQRTIAISGQTLSTSLASLAPDNAGMVWLIWLEFQDCFFALVPKALLTQFPIPHIEYVRTKTKRCQWRPRVIQLHLSGERVVFYRDGVCQDDRLGEMKMFCSNPRVDRRLG